MVCHLFGTKPLPEQMLTSCRLDWWFFGTNVNETVIKIQSFFPENASNYSNSPKMHLKFPSAKWQPFCPSLNVGQTALRVHYKTDCQIILTPQITLITRIGFTWSHNYPDPSLEKWRILTWVSREIREKMQAFNSLRPSKCLYISWLISFTCNKYLP